VESHFEKEGVSRRMARRGGVSEVDVAVDFKAGEVRQDYKRGTWCEQHWKRL